MAVNLDRLFLKILGVFQREGLLRGVRMFVEHPENRIIIEPFLSRGEREVCDIEGDNFDTKPELDVASSTPSRKKRSRRCKNDVKSYDESIEENEIDCFSKRDLFERHRRQLESNNIDPTSSSPPPPDTTSSPIHPSTTSSPTPLIIKQEPEFVPSEEWLEQRRLAIANKTPPNIEDVIVVDVEKRDPKPYKCAWCNYATSRKGSLRIHTNYHTGNRPYKCRYCPKAFQDSSVRISHELIHKERVECPLCFRKVRNIKRHVESVHRQFMCGRCSSISIFASRKSLLQHREEMHPKKSEGGIEDSGKDEEFLHF